MISEAFYAKIMGRVDRSGGCWISDWCPSNRYSTIWWGGRNALVHRLIYEWHKGLIPDGMEVDHLCRNKRCCNPAHLEVVTRHENLRRHHEDDMGNVYRPGAYCDRGHPRAKKVTLKSGERRCQVCQNAYRRKKYKDDPHYRAKQIERAKASQKVRRAGG